MKSSLISLITTKSHSYGPKKTVINGFIVIIYIYIYLTLVIGVIIPFFSVFWARKAASVEKAYSRPLQGPPLHQHDDPHIPGAMEDSRHWDGKFFAGSWFSLIINPIITYHQ